MRAYRMHVVIVLRNINTGTCTWLQCRGAVTRNSGGERVVRLPSMVLSRVLFWQCTFKHFRSPARSRIAAFQEKDIQLQTIFWVLSRVRLCACVVAIL